MNILIFGPPGSGKGTQAKLLKNKIIAHHISTGDIIRDSIKNNILINNKIKQEVISGNLISDNLMMEMFLNYLNKKKFLKKQKEKWIFDGIPRNISQAQILNNLNIEIHVIIDIFVKDKEIFNRLTGRLIHEPSGRTYSINSNPPKNAGKDDITGEDLIKRYDDNQITIYNRIKIYYNNYYDLINYYKCNKIKYIKLNGSMNVLDINKQILKNLLFTNKF